MILIIKKFYLYYYKNTITYISKLNYNYYKNNKI